jgi:ankyrin repeat protein
LYYACLEGLAEVAGHLITIEGADVNAQDGEYGNALQTASLEGHDKIVEVLLAKGADVNVQGGLYGNALQAASSGGHDKIIEILLTVTAERVTS